VHEAQQTIAPVALGLRDEPLRPLIYLTNAALLDLAPYRSLIPSWSENGIRFCTGGKRLSPFLASEIDRANYVI
jgi:hypothetical protein